MVGSLLLRGMVVGVIAGLLAFAFARVYGEPQVDYAIAFEENAGGHHHHHEATTGEALDEPELVSRATQAGFGLLTGIVVYGAALGGLISLVFAYAYGRIGSLGPRATAALIALGGFVAIVLVPALKYPANPPAVGSPETIGHRTALFFIMLAVSVVAMVLAIMLAKRLWAQRGSWNAVLIAAAAYVLVIAVVDYILPGINEVPEDFSATVLWNFRIASLGIHVVLWTTIGLVFGVVAERLLASGPAYRLSPRPAR